MLDRLSVDNFAPLVGDVFVVHADSLRLDFELLAAETYGREAAAVDDSGIRTPFSLTFKGPAEPLLPQRIYRLEHPALGPLDLFLVPTGRDAAEARYEAAFN